MTACDLAPGMNTTQSKKQHVEGLNPTSFFPEKETFKTTYKYASVLVNLASNQMRETREANYHRNHRTERDAENHHRLVKSPSTRNPGTRAM